MNYQIDAYSAYSPDLNSIEHVWVELKKRLQEQYPKLDGVSQSKINQKLIEVLPPVWETIPEEFFEKL